jgi:hypothetical protein
MGYMVRSQANLQPRSPHCGDEAPHDTVGPAKRFQHPQDRTGKETKCYTPIPYLDRWSLPMDQYSPNIGISYRRKVNIADP